MVVQRVVVQRIVLIVIVIIIAAQAKSCKRAKYLVLDQLIGLLSSRYTGTERVERIKSEMQACFFTIKCIHVCEHGGAQQSHTVLNAADHVAPLHHLSNAIMQPQQPTGDGGHDRIDK